MKELKKYGVAGLDYTRKEDAISDTYTTSGGRCIPTQFTFPENPFNQEIQNAKCVLEIGCGVGRNLRWVMENTNADYYGIDPNETMLEHFWEFDENKKWHSRAYISSHFDSVINSKQFDMVISTFVFMHLGYRNPLGAMNVTDITQEIMKHTVNGCVWFLWEHDGEEDWIPRWIQENHIDLSSPNMYVRTCMFDALKPMTHRNPLVGNGQGHHLILFQEQKRWNDEQTTNI